MQKILSKLHSIMSKVDYIQKDRKNDHFKYTYASEKAIKETLHPLLVEHGVLFSLDVVDVSVSGQLTTAKMRYRFFDTESGESLEGQFAGQGQDPSDKGIYKAVTGAIKYILTSTFLIPTGDDPEGDSASEAEKVFGANTAPKAASTKVNLTQQPKPSAAPGATGADNGLLVNECDSCHSGRVVRLKGVSKKTGKPYDFHKCEACGFTMDI